MKNNYFENINVSKNIDSAIEKGINQACREKRRRKLKKYMVASVVALVIVGSTTVFNKDVFANAKNIFYDIASYLGIESDISNYKTIINKSITNSGYTIKLNEVVLDKNELTVSSVIKSEDNPFEGFPSVVEALYINGERLYVNSNASSENKDDYTLNQVTTYFLDENIEGDVDIKIEYSGIQLLNDTGSKNIDGEWIFDFKTNTDELIKDTVSIDLNKKFKFKNGESIKLKKYVSNGLGQKIEFEESKNGINYDMKIIGKDNLGNNIELYIPNRSDGKGVFKLDNSKGSIDPKANTLTLSLQGRESNEDSWVKVGSDFNVKLLK
ncbi:MAG: DUF4179 domain-containing protein [Romboutsia sp.]